MLKATWGLITRWTEGFLKFLLNDKSWGSSVQAFIHIFFCFWKNTTFCHSFKRDTTFFRLHIFFSFHLFFFWVDSITFHSNHFLYPLGWCPDVHPVVHPVIFPVIRPVIRPVIHPVIRPFIRPVIWCFPIWLTTSLSYQNADLWCEWNSDILVFTLALA